MQIELKPWEIVDTSPFYFFIFKPYLKLSRLYENQHLTTMLNWKFKSVLFFGIIFDALIINAANVLWDVQEMRHSDRRSWCLKSLPKRDMLINSVANLFIVLYPRETRVLRIHNNFTRTTWLLKSFGHGPMQRNDESLSSVPVCSSLKKSKVLTQNPFSKL